MKLQLELEQCERAWHTAQDQYPLTNPKRCGRNASESQVCDGVRYLLAFVAMAIAVIVLVKMAGKAATPVATVMSVFWVVLALVLHNAIAAGRQHERAHEQAETAYRLQRDDLQRRIQTLQKSAQRASNRTHLLP